MNETSPNYSRWTPSYLYSAGDKICGSNGEIMEAYYGGQSGLCEPDWGVNGDSLIWDNTILWRCFKVQPILDIPPQIPSIDKILHMELEQDCETTSEVELSLIEDLIEEREI